MKVGTKSVLFGVHQFVLHPLFVCWAWRKLYGTWPSAKQTVCIFLHDIGYLTTTTMDGEDGILHPLLGGAIATRLFGNALGDFVRFHSRSVAAIYCQPPSALCAPDKLSTLLYPTRLYLWLANLSGEIKEYKARMMMQNRTDRVWLRETRVRAYTWALQNVAPNDRERLIAAFALRVEEREPTEMVATGGPATGCSAAFMSR